MQQNPVRRSNTARTRATRKALIAAARKVFVARGYGDTGTPEIAAAARVTRGALYHHFAGKSDLFRAVVLEEAGAVAAQIREDSRASATPIDALMAGADAYFAAMSAPGRARLLLIDGPSVLGHDEMVQLNKAAGENELRAGLAAALADGGKEAVPLDALTELTSAAFDRAALAIAMGKPEHAYKTAIQLILNSLVERVK